MPSAPGSLLLSIFCAAGTIVSFSEELPSFFSGESRPSLPRIVPGPGASHEVGRHESHAVCTEKSRGRCRGTCLRRCRSGGSDAASRDAQLAQAPSKLQALVHARGKELGGCCESIAELLRGPAARPVKRQISSTRADAPPAVLPVQRRPLNQCSM